MELIGKLLGRNWRFNALKYQTQYIRYRYAEPRVPRDCPELWIDVDDGQSEGPFQLESTFTIVPGLSGTGISFKSNKYPELFLGVATADLFQSDHDDPYSEQFLAVLPVFPNNYCYLIEPHWPDSRLSATWLPVEGLSDKEHYSFESAALPGYYMRHCGFRVQAGQRDGSQLFNDDATWLAHSVGDYQIEPQGEWVLVYGNDNAATQKWEFARSVSTTVGIQVHHSESTTTETGWKVGAEVGAEASAEGCGLSVKSMFEAHGMQSVTRLSETTWSQSHTTTVNTTYSGDPNGKEKGFYLWQWVVSLGTQDGVAIKAASERVLST